MPLTGEQHRRLRHLLILSAALLLLLLAGAFNLKFRAAELPVPSNLVVLALFNLNLVVLLLLLVLLFRNLVKLWFERRQDRIGSRFKTKLVFSFLLLALAPAILIFVIASNFITRSIEGWFKPQVERPLDQAMEVAQTYYRHLESTALRHAQQIARIVARDRLLEPAQRGALTAFVREQQAHLGLGVVTVLDAAGRVLVHVGEGSLGEGAGREMNEQRLRQGLAGHDVTSVRELPAGDLIEAVTPVWVPGAGDGAAGRRADGVVIVGTQVTERLEAKVRAIADAFREYKQFRLLRNPVKGIYILLFLLMTLIIVFSFTWFGLYLARGITDPIAELAEGTREVAAGNLSYKVKARADDEIGALVDSFNRMTDDLSESKRRLEEAYVDLQDKHTELEERRRYIETVLEAIATGVVSLDAQGRLTTLNRAAARMFGLADGAGVGRHLEEAFASPELADVVTLVRRLRRARTDTLEQELHLRRNGVPVSLLAFATALRGPDGEFAGAVIVFDDLTELIKAQRLAAWREVAQRIAHEIKNPLTPIQLSAQRLRRRLPGGTGEEKRLVAECTETIIHEVEGLKRLVEEFSRFARMPALAPRPTDLRPLIDTVAALYRESHPRLSLGTRYATGLPLLEVDPDRIKRAIQNLVDNAVEAVGGTGEVEIAVDHLGETGRIRVTVSDRGPGIAPEDRERLFLPYFSTKTSGTGLGLTIVHDIVTEHGGSIRVEDNLPGGSRFIIELPVSRAAAAVGA